MKPEAKAEVACWLGCWLVPIVLFLLLTVATAIFGDVVTCAGRAAARCTPGQHVVHWIGVFFYLTIFLMTFGVPIYFLTLVGRLAYLLFKRINAK